MIARKTWRPVRWLLWCWYRRFNLLLTKLWGKEGYDPDRISLRTAWQVSGIVWTSDIWESFRRQERYRMQPTVGDE